MEFALPTFSPKYGIFLNKTECTVYWTSGLDWFEKYWQKFVTSAGYAGSQPFCPPDILPLVQIVYTSIYTLCEEHLSLNISIYTCILYISIYTWWKQYPTHFILFYSMWNKHWRIVHSNFMLTLSKRVNDFTEIHWLMCVIFSLGQKIWCFISSQNYPMTKTNQIGPSLHPY